MIIKREQLNLNNKCVVEKLLIKTPFKFGSTFQDEACFLFIKDGESIINSSTERIHLYVSESVLLKCGSYFSEQLQKFENRNCEILAFHLHRDILEELYHKEFPSFIKYHREKSYAQKIEKEDIIIQFINSLELYFQNPKLVNDELLKLKIKELILLLVHTSNAENIISLFSFLFSPRKANLLEVTQSHLFSKITIPELATLSGRSLSAFKRDFEIVFKDTPANYIKEQKLLKAMQLLVSTDFSISEICYEVGFTDTSHFSKLFKMKYKITPSCYRKRKLFK